MSNVSLRKEVELEVDVEVLLNNESWDSEVSTDSWGDIIVELQVSDENIEEWAREMGMVFQGEEL